MNALARLLDDDYGTPPSIRGARLGVAQANALVCPLGVLMPAPAWMRPVFLVASVFGWAAWARRDFALRVRCCPCQPNDHGDQVCRRHCHRWAARG